MRLMGDSPRLNRGAIKLLIHGGNKIKLGHELQLPFVNWVLPVGKMLKGKGTTNFYHALA